LVWLLFGLGVAMNAEAAVRTETVEYADGPVALEGFFDELFRKGQ
jgi:hypothetical protein